MNPATCSSCMMYHQKGQGTGYCHARTGEPWKAPYEVACKEYTADSPEGI